MEFIILYNWTMIYEHLDENGSLCPYMQELGGWTTMHLACRYGHHSLVCDLMTQYGMDPNQPKNVSPSIILL